MGAQAFGRQLATLIGREAAELRQRIGSGSCSNIEAYKSECGRAKGLEEAVAKIEAELKKLQTEDA